MTSTNQAKEDKADRENGHTKIKIINHKTSLQNHSYSALNTTDDYIQHIRFLLNCVWHEPSSTEP